MYLPRYLARFSGLLMLVATLGLQGCQPDGNEVPPPAATAYPWQTPRGFVQPTFPPDNPMTIEGVMLGRRLFYDKRLSDDNTQSCASCHLQDAGFSDPERFSTGIDGIQGSRNAMALVNLAWQDFLFWDGRENSLESQAIQPVIDPIEMHTTWPEVEAKLRADPLYPALFKKAFGSDQISQDRITKALAQFERSLVSANSKFDRWFRGEETFTAQELEGYTLFNSERGDCFHCHGDLNTGLTFGAFGNVQFSNNGLDSTLVPGSGYERVTGNPADRAKFKIPTLRNVEYTAPFMHDGRFATLRQVIEHYNFGGHPSATLDPNMKAAGIGRNWSLEEKDALLAFMLTLSDPVFLTDTSFADPEAP